MLLAGCILSLIIYWLAAHVDKIGNPSGFPGEMAFPLELSSIRRLFESGFVRIAAAMLLACFAAKLFLERYGLLTEDHGQYLVGVDWVADHVVLPLQWLMIAGCLIAAALVAAKKPGWVLFVLILLPIRWFLPSVVSSLYVRPNELALEKPYIEHHIDATRSGYGLKTRVTETVLNTASEVPIDYASHKALLDNVRLWDWRAFHDTISQIQPLRPYVYQDTDVDRYIIDGQLRQVLMAPRELQLSQIGEAVSRWINPHLIYTHGYGVVMAEANRITTDGLPVLFIKDAPPGGCNQKPATDRARALLQRRSRPRTGLRENKPARVQLSLRLTKRSDHLSRRWRLSDFFPAAPPGGGSALCGWQYFVDRIPQRQKPHDDSPHRAGANANDCRLFGLGRRPLSGAD